LSVLLLFTGSDDLYGIFKLFIANSERVISLNSSGICFGWGLMVFNATFQLYRGGKFYWWGTPDSPEKATDLPQFT